MSGRDPIQRVAERSRDLYDVAAWDPRSRLDRLSVALHGGLVTSGRALLVAVAILIVFGQLALVGVAAAKEPLVGGYILLSVLPAFLLAVYIWASDATMREPIDALVVTFLLGFLFAGFAAVLNVVLRDVIEGFGGVLGLGPVVLLPLFFFLVVGPVEETVKWAAVRLHAYRHDAFDAVVDGAVYGAVAGLGFATIENSLYITRQFLNAASVGGAVLTETFQTAAVRSLAGPGHVIYSAFAGYYLGLAKYNPRNRGPIVVKGLLIATLIHATYNTSVTFLPAASDAVPFLSDVGDPLVFFGFVVVYDGVFGYALYRKLSRYRRVYRESGAARIDREQPVDGPVELEEFEWDRSAVGAAADADANPERDADVAADAEMNTDVAADADTDDRSE